MDTLPASRKQQTHDRILDVAAGALREGGFSGVGVADIMKRAGLTHGGFYAHFPSRDALLAEALERAGQDSQARLRKSIAAGAARSRSSLAAMVEGYLSDRHLAACASGCPVAALASEMPRQSDAVRAAAAARIEALTQAIRATLAPGQAADSAGIIAAQLVGALQIARTLGNNAKGRAHLAAARRFLLATFDSPRPPAH